MEASSLAFQEDRMWMKNMEASSLAFQEDKMWKFFLLWHSRKIECGSFFFGIPGR